MVSGWQYHANLIASLAARMAGSIPVIWGVRQSELDRESTKALTLFTIWLSARLSHWLPKRIVYCAESASKVHASLGFAAEKTMVIPNGYDLKQFRPDPLARESIRAELGMPNGSLIIGMAARFDPVKDHRNFLHAARLVHNERPDVHFVLCGYKVDWENKELVQWIGEVGLGESVYLLGRRDDMPTIMAAFDIACLSSFVEGFPNVVSEAMSCAVPCVVTDVGEGAFIVGNAGRVVEPKNPNSLAKALLELIELGPHGRRQLGNAARQRIKDYFDLPQVVKQYESLFQEVVCAR